MKTSNGGWRATTALDEDPATIELPAPSVQIAWADTRDVILPSSPNVGNPQNLDSFPWYNYSPPGTGNLSACNAGSRNQNPYTAEATMGVLASAPLTFKDPNLPRSYPLYIQNKTPENQIWRATIDSAASASFNYPAPNAIQKQEAEFVLRSYSTVTGTVYVNQSYSAPFKVTFQRIDGPLGAAVNGPGNFTVVSLNTTGGTDPAAATKEAHDPLIATDVLVFTHPPDATGRLPVDPYVQDDPNQNPLGQNPLGQNPLGQNPLGQNPLGQNAQPQEITDYTYRVRNGGTTHSAYKALVNFQQQLDPTLYRLQVIVNRVTRAPGLSRKDCKTLGYQFQPVQISNVETPLGQNPLGQNPLGQNPLGQNPLGQNPLGQNPFGQNPLGQNPLGQNALASDDNYSTFYVAPSPTTTTASLNKSQLQWAGSAARPAGGGRFVRVSSRAEYLNALSSSVDFSLGDRAVDEVWWTLRVSRLRPLTTSDVPFNPKTINLAVVSTAPNVVLQNGVVTVTDPPAAFKAPDLVYASPLSALPATSRGFPITLPAMPVQNIGTASAVPFRQGLYLRSALIPDGLLLGQGDPTPAALDAGASLNVPGVVATIPPHLPAGSYEACAVLDPTNVVAESLENNNSTCVPLVLLQPDLKVIAITHSPTGATTADPVTFAVTVKNDGPGSAVASTLSFSYGDGTSAIAAIPVLAGGATYPVALTHTFGAGTYTSTAIVDANNDVEEFLFENNNQAGHTFTVALPFAIAEAQPLDGHVGSLYPPSPQALTTTGGGAPFTWTVDPNARIYNDDEQLVAAILPPGLQLGSDTGIISGTPTTVGSFAFRVIATDALGHSAAHNFCIHIEPNLEADLVTMDISAGQTATNLAASLLDPDDAGVAVQNATTTGSNLALGSFTGGGGPAQGVGFDRGILLSSGTVIGAKGPNSSSSFGSSLGKPGDADLASLAGTTSSNTHDAAILEFDFTPTCHEGATCGLTFEYVFGSDEFHEYANTSFNDVFGFFLTDTTAGGVPKNYAVLPGVIPETPVSINTVNGGRPLGTDAKHPEFFRSNRTTDIATSGPLNVQADGLTKPLQFSATVTSGHVYHIKIGITDVSDGIYDSWVFIKSGSFKITHVCPVIVQ